MIRCLTSHMLSTIFYFGHRWNSDCDKKLIKVVINKPTKKYNQWNKALTNIYIITNEDSFDVPYIKSFIVLI